MDVQQGGSKREQLKSATRQQEGRDEPNPGASQLSKLAQVAALVNGTPAPAPAGKRAIARDDEPPREEWDEDTPEDEPPPRAPTGEEDEAPDDDAGEGEPDDDAGPGTIDDVAKRLGLTRKELNAVEVEVNGDKMTLGELKAKLPELVKLDQSRAEWEESRDKQGLEVLDARRRVYALVEAFPAGSIPPALMQRIEADHSETLKREAAMLHSARPDWADPTYREASLKGMAEVAGKYGITLGDLRSVSDHRQLLLLQDFAKLQAKVDKARTDARRQSLGIDSPMSRESASTQPTNQRSRARSNAQKGAEVARMLRSR